MIEIVKQLLASQYEASLCTISHCVARCPDELWHAPVAKFPFCQVAFHALFFADYYLSPDPNSFRQQPFHSANPLLFGKYEQFDDGDFVSHCEKSQIEDYLSFCRSKAIATIAAETERDLSAPSKFWLKCPRAELHVYNIRHIQHHAAQLILRLRLDSNVDIPWVSEGWLEPTSHSQ